MGRDDSEKLSGCGLRGGSCRRCHRVRGFWYEGLAHMFASAKVKDEVVGSSVLPDIMVEQPRSAEQHAAHAHG